MIVRMGGSGQNQHSMGVVYEISTLLIPHAAFPSRGMSHEVRVGT